MELTRLKPVKTLDELAKKHNTTRSKLEQQLEKGIKVEKEHTKDEHTARAIALHHLDEVPDYYDKLEQVEKHAATNKVKAPTYKDVEKEYEQYIKNPNALEDFKHILPLLMIMPFLQKYGLDRPYYPFPSQLLMYGPPNAYSRLLLAADLARLALTYPHLPNYYYRPGSIQLVVPPEIPK